MKKRNVLALLLLTLSLSISKAYSFTRNPYPSSGMRALHYKKLNDLWLHWTSIITDANSKTSPPDTEYIERKLQSFVSVGNNMVLTPNASLRVDIVASSSLYKAEEKSPPRSPYRESQSQISPAIDFTYVNPQGLELTLGLERKMLVDRRATFKSERLESTTEYEKQNADAYRFALVKRSGAWSAGAYYVGHSEAVTSFSSVSDDGSSVSGESFVTIYSKYGIVSQFAYLSFNIELDLSSIQASEGGDLTNEGKSVRDNYFSTKLAVSFPLAAGILKLGLARENLSYSNLAYANIDTIPLTTLKASLFLGTAQDSFVLDAIVGYGEDNTSVPEYNAKISLLSFGFGLGLIF